MQIITPDLITKYQLNSLKMEATLSERGLAIKFSPFRIRVDKPEMQKLQDAVMRCFSDGSAAAIATATADGVEATGLDTKMPSFRTISESLLRIFEDVRMQVRTIQQYMHSEEYDEAARGIALAIAAGEYDLQADGLLVEPIDMMATRDFATAVLSAFAGIRLEHEGPMRISGCPSFLPQAMREEVDAKIKEQFLRQVCRELAGTSDRAKAGIEAAEAIMTSDNVNAALDKQAQEDDSAQDEFRAAQDSLSAAPRNGSDAVEPVAASASFGDEM